jgi:hypothetical protein
MLKRLAMLIGLVMVIAIVLVARFDKNDDTSGHSYDIKCIQPSDPSMAAASLSCTLNPIQNANQSQSNPLWWHKLIAWPEGITAWLLLLTLGAIAWQAWETRKAAQSTEASALAFVTSQRPQILVTAHGNPPHDLMGEPPYVQMELQNQGPTTARNLSYEWWIEVLPFDEARPDDFADFTTAAYHYSADHRMSVYPQQQPVIIHIPLGRRMTDIERREILGVQKVVCIRVRVIYRDAFSSFRQYANFGYWMQKDGLGFLPTHNDSGAEQEQP